MAQDSQRDAAFAPTANLESLLDLDSFEHLGLGQGGYNEDHEFYGYRMPI